MEVLEFSFFLGGGEQPQNMLVSVVLEIFPLLFPQKTCLKNIFLLPIQFFPCFFFCFPVENYIFSLVFVHQPLFGVIIITIFFFAMVCLFI